MILKFFDLDDQSFMSGIVRIRGFKKSLRRKTSKVTVATKLLFCWIDNPGNESIKAQGITQTLLRPGNNLDIQTGPSSVPYLDPLRGSKHLLQDDLDMTHLDQRSSC